MPNWKETERYAIIALVVYTIFYFVPLCLNSLSNYITGPELPPIITPVMLIGLQRCRTIGFGHWLSALNRGRGYKRLVWFLFGFLFGVTGVAIFYVIKLVSFQQEKDIVTNA